eukprot:scaffold1256_cov150-Skeletonema_menzelii.AAC.1
MPSTKRQPLKKQQLPTPMRSPMPRDRRDSCTAGRQNTLSTAPAMTTSSKSPKAASSSEKETPTVVLTAMTKNVSPYNLSTNCDDHPSSLKKNEHDDVKGGRITVMERKCHSDNSTQQSNHSTRKKNFQLNDLSDEESLEGGGVAEMKKKFRDKFSEESPGEKDDDSLENMFGEENIINAIQNLLQGGIASICRLRKLFPASFFMTFDLDCTSVTQFNVEYIEQALRRSVDGYSNDEEFEYDGDDDCLEERSMMKSISTKKSTAQKTLSPLTKASQWLSQYEAGTSQRGTNAALPDFGGDAEALKKWQKQAMEALTLVQWMGNTTQFLSEGKLARIIFSVCDGDELIESYSFQLSFVEQSQIGGVQKTQFEDSTGEFFRNLNGYSAGSGTLLPAKTQSSFASQGFTQASSPYFTQQSASMPQKQSQSVRLTQQRKLLMSMSQSVRSIRASANKIRAYQIPESRYLSLDVKFTDEIEVDNLPGIFQEHEDDTTSPFFPVEDTLNDQFVVTPIGTISESCLSGIKVDLHAYSKSNGCREEDEDKSVYFSQHSHSCPDQKFDADCSTSSNSEISDSEDSDSLAYAIPKGLAGENMYLPCRFLGHRKSTEINGEGKEEFKLKFDNELLTSKGMKKQWILAKNVLSSTEMYTKIKQAMNDRRGKNERKGVNMTTFEEESIAKNLKVPVEVVEYIVERGKRKKQQAKTEKQKKHKR